MKNKNIIILTYPRTGGNLLDSLLLSNVYLNDQSIHYHTEFNVKTRGFSKTHWEKYISTNKKSNFLCRIHYPNKHFFSVKNSFFILLYRTDILDWFLSKIIAGRTGVFQYRNKHKIPDDILVDPTENDIRREITRLRDFSKFYKKNKEKIDLIIDYDTHLKTDKCKFEFFKKSIFWQKEQINYDNEFKKMLELATSGTSRNDNRPLLKYLSFEEKKKKILNWDEFISKFTKIAFDFGFSNLKFNL
jgi:hypothetical protein